MWACCYCVYKRKKQWPRVLAPAVSGELVWSRSRWADPSRTEGRIPWLGGSWALRSCPWYWGHLPCWTHPGPWNTPPGKQCIFHLSTWLIHNISPASTRVCTSICKSCRANMSTLKWLDKSENSVYLRNDLHPIHPLLKSFTQTENNNKWPKSISFFFLLANNKSDTVRLLCCLNRLNLCPVACISERLVGHNPSKYWLQLELLVSRIK